MSDSKNLQALRSAYQQWHETKGESQGAWLELMADEVQIHTVGEEGVGLDFAKDSRSKEEAVAFLAGICEHWDMIHWTPDAFVEDGDRIAMFGTCAWTYRQNGKDVETDIAHLWQFADGKVVSLVEIFDSAKAVAAATASRD